MMVTDNKNATSSSLPPALPGFEHIARSWDPQHLSYTANIKPGEFYVTKNRTETIQTTLGSCIAACIRDKNTGVGGMNHFMLPLKGSVYHQKFTKSPVIGITRYGNWAMEFLINEILKAGGTRRNLEVKIFGGGCVLKNMTDIGQKNIQFVLEYIHNENLFLVNQDVGDIYPRKIIYFPFSGVVKVKKMPLMEAENIVQEEESYLQKISSHAPPAGGIELF